VSYRCAGINHQAWYLDFLWNGKDAYPLIREAVAKEETYNEEQVRNQMLLHLGYFVTESSGHNSEYNAWFRKREDLLEKYCTHGTGWNPGINALKRWGKRDETAKAYDWKAHADELFAKPFSLERGNEYAASIFNAIFGDGEPFEFNGNVLNHGLIENLPYECCVEVPVLATRRGLDPIQIGKLPPQLAILNNINAGCEELAVEAHLTGDPRKVFHAICHDPLTSAVLSLDEIQAMVDDMFEVSREWLPKFKHVN
jgi:alpha-galactosidase